jgi:tetratricopeptide (TPR) repeat protein
VNREGSSAFWHQVDRVFDALLDAPAEERGTALDRMLEIHPEAVVREVRGLIDALDATHPVLATPAPFQVDIAEPADDPPPATIGPWRIGELLGAGGQGRVYIATKQAEQFEQIGALKLLADHLETSALQRFLRERQTQARLRHPNIATLLDAGASDDGRPFLVSEYIEGSLLDHYLDRQRLSTAECIRLLLPVVDAVAHAHQQFILHRDIKPANIIVDAEGNSYLLDFGVSAALAQSAVVEDSNASLEAGKQALDRVPFTPSYAAPEQILNEPVDVRTDCWALGAVLYRALAGSSPFAAEDASRTIRAVLDDPIDAPSDDPELNSIVARCLTRSRDGRYDTVAALRRDLEAWLAGGLVSAAATSRWYGVSKWLKRHRLLALSSVLLALSLAVGAAVSAFQAQQAAEQRDRATEAAQQYQSAVGLLVDVFNGANPAQHRGDIPTADDLLEEARSRVRAMEGQPGVQATLAHELAAVYLNRGDGLRAARLATLAIEKFELAGRTRSETFANALVSLATALKMLGRYDESAARLDQSLRVQRDHLWTIDDWRYAYTENMLGGVLARMGDHQTARERFASALNAIRGADGAPPWLEGTVRRNLWDSTIRLGDASDAKQALEQWLAAQATNGPEEPRASAQASLGDIALIEARYRDAQSHYIDATRLLADIYGPDHPDVVFYGERAAWVELLATAASIPTDRASLSERLAPTHSEGTEHERIRLTGLNYRLSLTPRIDPAERAAWVRGQFAARETNSIADRLIWHQHLLLHALAAHVARLPDDAREALNRARSVNLYRTDQAAWQRELEEQVAALIEGDDQACATLKESLTGNQAPELAIAARQLPCLAQDELG